MGTMNSKSRIALLGVVGVILTASLWMAAQSQHYQPKLTYSQFLEDVRAGQVASVIVIGSKSTSTQASCRLRDGRTARTVLPADYRDALVAMQDEKVNVEIQESSPSLGSAIPFLVLLGVWIVLMALKLPTGRRARS